MATDEQFFVYAMATAREQLEGPAALGGETRPERRDRHHFPLLDCIPAGGHDLHIGDGDSSRLAVGCYRHAIALREPGSDKIVEHLQFEAVAQHKRFHGGAVRIDGEQLGCPALVVRQMFLRARRHTAPPYCAPALTSSRGHRLPTLCTAVGRCTSFRCSFRRRLTLTDAAYGGRGNRATDRPCSPGSGPRARHRSRGRQQS